MSSKQQQLTTTLLQFYRQPVAQVSLELFLSIAAVIFFALFAIRPTLLTMSDLIKEIEDKRKLDTQLSQKIAALSTAQTEYLALQEDLPILDEAIPSTPQLVNTFQILEKLASERKLVITTIGLAEIPPETPEDATEVKKLNRLTIPVKVGVTGDYPTIRQFIEDIKNSRRSFIVESVVFSTGEERGARKLSASLTVEVPYFGTAKKGDTPGDTP